MALYCGFHHLGLKRISVNSINPPYFKDAMADQAGGRRSQRTPSRTRAHCSHHTFTSSSQHVHDSFGLMKILSVTSSQEVSIDGADNYLQGLLVLADVDPATAKVVIGITGPFLSAFGFLFILRIVMSWYPKLPVDKFPYVLAYAPTEPFLRVTRKLIPPLGGVDVTPVVWFGLVSFLNEILVGPQGLLVLLSQQV